MDKNNKITKKNEEFKNRFGEDEYAYSFVPELDMWLNIDKQKEDAIKFSKLTDIKYNKKNK